MNEQQLYQPTKQKQQLFFPRKEKEKRKKKKRICLSKQPGERRLSRFFGKILPEAERRCGDFGENPEGLTLY